MVSEIEGFMALEGGWKSKEDMQIVKVLLLHVRDGKTAGP